MPDVLFTTIDDSHKPPLRLKIGHITADINVMIFRRDKFC